MADGGWPAWKPPGSRSFGQSATNERKATATTPIILKRYHYPYLGLDMQSLPRNKFSISIDRFPMLFWLKGFSDR